MKIERVALIGAGAIGGYFVWGLSEKLGDNLLVIAEGERKDRLSNQGITVNGEKFELNVKSPKEAAEEGAFDLILVATKYGSLREVLPGIKMLTQEKTVVMSLLNGIDSEEIIAEEIGMEHMVFSLMKIASEREGDSIRFNPRMTMGLFFGEKDTKEHTKRTLAIKELFAGTKIRATFEADILKAMWMKLGLNCSKNLPQAVLGVGIGAYVDSPHVDFLSHGIWDEVQAIAGARGIQMDDYPFSMEDRCPNKWARYSTLQDLEAGRKTEIDMFAGTLMKLGEELSIPVPYLTYTYHAIKALEEKNDGLFEYAK